MRTSIAGLAVLIYVIYLFFEYGKNSNELLVKLFAINLVYESFINVGSFIIIGGQYFSVADFLQFISVFVSLFVITQSGTRVGLLAFLFAIIASVLSLLVQPYDEMVRTFNGIDYVNNIKFMHYPNFDLQTIKTSLRFICFGINSYAVSEVITEIEWRRIKSVFFRAGGFIIIYAWIEFILKNVLNVYITEQLIRIVFGKDTSNMSALIRNGVRVVIGLNNEPSQFCMMLFGYFVIYIVSKEYEIETRSEKLINASGILLMVLCTSFRVVGLLPILIILYFITKKSSNAVILSTFTLGVLLIVLYISGAMDYYLMRLGRTFYFLDTLDTSIGGGEAGRLNTIVEALRVFVKRPILGIGPGQTFSYGFIPCALVMIGVVGLGTWYVLMFGTIGELGDSISFNYDCVKILFILSIAWFYNDSISTGYSIRILAIALAMKFYNEAYEHDGKGINRVTGSKYIKV